MAVTLSASKQGLEIVDQARRKKGWEATAPAWYQDANTTPATLKRFRQGKAIQQDVFINICKAVGVNWEKIVDQSPLSEPESQRVSFSYTPTLLRQTNSKPEFFAYDDAWIGREQLVAELSEKLRGAYRLLVILGLTGIGKTALAEKLAVELQDWFSGDWKNRLCRVNFDNEDKTTDFASVAVRWLEEWGEKLSPEDKKAELLLYKLVKHLRENQVLVLIDSLERLLTANQEDGWSDFVDTCWEKFFLSILSAETCQSRLIITSQDLPGGLLAKSSRSQNFWYCQPLSGLEEKERLDLFEKTGLDVSIQSSVRIYLERIGAAYEGHPLALRIIASEINHKPFEGNALAYWNKYGNEIEKIEKAIEKSETGAISGYDKLDLHQFTRQLRINLGYRLEQMFKRLERDAPNAYLLLCQSSVYRFAVDEEAWLIHLEYLNCNEEQQRAALDILRDRYLVEEVIENNQLLLRQHNLIRSIALELLNRHGKTMSNPANLEVISQQAERELGIPLVQKCQDLKEKKKHC